jgi:hypothetical protein
MKCLVLLICLVFVLELVIAFLFYIFVELLLYSTIQMKLQVESGGYFYPKNKITKIKIMRGKSLRHRIIKCCGTNRCSVGSAKRKSPPGKGNGTVDQVVFYLQSEFTIW